MAVGTREHLLNRVQIFGPPRAIAIILKAGLPPFPGVLQPLGKAAVLLVLRHMDEQLDDGRVVVDLFGLEDVDPVISSPPFGFAAKTLTPSNHTPDVPPTAEIV